MFESVLFDWDGTLVDAMPMVVASFQKILREIHCTVSDEFIERRIGIGAAETFREALRASKVSFSEDWVKRLVDKKIQAEIDLSGNVKLFPGATELLVALQGKFKLALASMNNRAVIEHLTSELNVRTFFDIVLTADEVQRPKPDPEIFLQSAAKLGSLPDKCVVVEDSLFGVEAAKAARMSCVAVLTGVYSREELEKANADLIVNSLKDQSAIFNFVYQ